uniref:Ribosomal protein S10 n=1 Tax=Paramormyrops kingsleyae TaxID=1676925 RepID=A0A3B3R9S1_9TELE|nr:40S ribosomal protein S10-like [Paramormyrops kingsleyae]
MSPKIKRHSSFEGHPGCRTTWRRAAASRVPSVRQAPLLAHVGVRAHAPAFPAPVPQQAAEMLMPKKNRVAIYELLFKEGVMVAKKDVHLAKHPELADKNVPNLHVMKAMQSLKSRGYVKEQFAWRHFYWYLTNEGIQYLRDFLHLPPEIVPATLRRQTRPETARPRPKALDGERPARLARGEADRDTYRRSAAPPGADKKAEAGAGASADFQFRGGFGRGRGQQPQ